MLGNGDLLLGMEVEMLEGREHLAEAESFLEADLFNKLLVRDEIIEDPAQYEPNSNFVHQLSSDSTDTTEGVFTSHTWGQVLRSSTEVCCKRLCLVNAGAYIAWEVGSNTVCILLNALFLHDIMHNLRATCSCLSNTCDSAFCRYAF